MSDSITTKSALDESLIGRELPEQPEWVGERREFNRYRKREKSPRGKSWRAHVWPDEIACIPRLCTGCKETKPTQQFGPNKQSKDGISHRCRECMNATARKNPSRNADNSYLWNLKRNYGLTIDEYNAMLEAQDRRCGVCRRHESEIAENGRMGARRLGVDHDHERNCLRGLLCQGCNTALGLLKNDPALVVNAVFYLQAYEERIK